MEQNTNNTVQQLSKALNQLLDAYETLQAKNKSLEDEIVHLKETIKELEFTNKNLQSQLDSLSSTTEQQSHEMSNMLSRISSILTTSETSKSITNENQEDMEESIENKDHDDSLDALIESKTKKDTDSYFKKDQEEDDDIIRYSSTSGLDLNRMQSLLNGLNN